MLSFLNVIAACLALVVAEPPTEPTLPTRTVQVNVTVRRDAQPFVGVPLVVRVRGAREDFFGTTADGGVAHIQVKVPTDGPCDLLVRAGQPPPAPHEPYQAFRARRAPLESMLRNYTFRDKRAAVGAIESQVSVGLDVAPAIWARFELRQSGQPFLGRKFVAGPTFARTFGVDVAEEHVVIGSLRRSMPAAAYVVYGGNMGTIKRVNIDPPQEDVDLGIVELTPEVESACSLNALLTGFLALEKWSEPYQPGLTLVSTDGSLIVTRAMASVEGPYRLPDGECPRFPAGTFYIAPGKFLGRTAQVALIERVVAGEDLSKTAIPRVTLVPEHESQMKIDLAQAEKAILDGWKGEE